MAPISELNGKINQIATLSEKWTGITNEETKQRTMNDLVQLILFINELLDAIRKAHKGLNEDVDDQTYAKCDLWCGYTKQLAKALQKRARVLHHHLRGDDRVDTMDKVSQVGERPGRPKNLKRPDFQGYPQLFVETLMDAIRVLEGMRTGLDTVMGG